MNIYRYPVWDLCVEIWFWFFPRWCIIIHVYSTYWYFCLNQNDPKSTLNVGLFYFSFLDFSVVYVRGWVRVRTCECTRVSSSACSCFMPSGCYCLLLCFWRWVRVVVNSSRTQYIPSLTPATDKVIPNAMSYCCVFQEFITQAQEARQKEEEGKVQTTPPVLLLFIIIIL